MISADRLLAFGAMSFLLIVIPGPSVLFVIGRALAHGRRAALTTVVGNTLGAYVLVVAVAFGIGPIVARSAVVFTALKLAGAAYLVYLGVKAFENVIPCQRVDRGQPEGNTHRTLWDGFAVGSPIPRPSCSSPLCSAVRRPVQGHLVVQMLTLGMIFNVIAPFPTACGCSRLCGRETGSGGRRRGFVGWRYRRADHDRARRDRRCDGA